MSWSSAGIIETNEDIDVFSFTAPGEKFRLNVDVAALSPNLDVVLQLHDATGQVTTVEPSGRLGASIVDTLPAGDYTLSVKNNGTYGYLGTYTVDGFRVASGPLVVESTPRGVVDSALPSVRLTFEHAIDPTTFSPEDVTIAGPAGAVDVTAIVPVPGTGNRQYDIQFPTQTTPGNYDLTVAADVLDPAGNRMNQDQDRVVGEDVEDRFATRFSIAARGSAFVLSGADTVYANDLEIDSSGHVYLTGLFQETVDFDPGPGAVELTASDIGYGFVARYSPDHELEWVQPMSVSDGSLRGYGLVLDETGNVYVTGYFGTSNTLATATFGSITRTSEGSGDAFLAKLDSAGDFVWVTTWGGVESDTATGIAIAPDGTIHVGGRYRDAVDFDASSDIFVLTSVDASSDGYVTSFDSSGNFLNAVSFGGAGSDDVDRVAIDASGDVYAVGLFRETAQFGPDHTLQSSDSGDAFLVKLNDTYDVQWVRQASGESSISIPNVGVDGVGDVYLTTWFSQSVHFGGNTPTLFNTGGRDSVIAKWDADGVFQWARQIEGDETNRIYNVDFDPYNNVFVSGYFGGTTDFAPGQRAVPRTGTGSADDFLLGLDPHGDFRLVHHIERDSGTPRAMAVDSQGNVYLAADLSGNVVLPTGDLFDTPTGHRDLYVLRLDLAPGIAVTPSGRLRTSEDGEADTFEIVLETAPTADVTIGLSSSDTGEGIVAPASLKFTPQDWYVPKTVSVRGVDDALVDGHVAYSIITAPATSTDPSYSGLNAIDVSVTNLDNEGRRVSEVVRHVPHSSGTQWRSVAIDIDRNAARNAPRAATSPRGDGPATATAAVASTTADSTFGTTYANRGRDTRPRESFEQSQAREGPGIREGVGRQGPSVR